MTSATPAKAQMIRKLNRLISGKEKILVVWIEDQTNHNIPLNQILIYRKTLTFINSVKAERGKEAAEEILKPGRLVHEV